MRDIYMFCDDPDCPCEDICCQDCEKREQCENRCLGVIFKENIYASDDFLADTLDAEADKQDSWLLAVAVGWIREAMKEKKERDELRAVLKNIADTIDRALCGLEKPSTGDWLDLLHQAHRVLEGDACERKPND